LPVVAGLGHLNEQISFPESMQNIETWMRNMEETSKIALQMLSHDKFLQYKFKTNYMLVVKEGKSTLW